MKEWFSYNAFSQKWYNANGDVVEPCEINNKLRSTQNELPALRQERDLLKKRVEELEEANKVLSDGLGEIGIAVVEREHKKMNKERE